MYDYRIAKCLENGRVREYVIFNDGSKKRPIETNDDGEQYFIINNKTHCDLELEEFNSHGKNYLREILSNSFANREKDLVESIRKGYADQITMGNLPFGVKLVNGIYYLNREYGEEKRKQTLKDLEGCEFRYSVTYKFHIITTDGAIDFDRDPNKWFTSVDQAIKFINTKIDEAYNYSMKFIGRIYADHNTELLDEFNNFWDMYDESLLGELVDGGLTFKENSPLDFKDNNIKMYWKNLFEISSKVILNKEGK